MSDNVSIEQIISAWKADWGNEFPRRKEDRLMQFNAFFQTAKGYGYDTPEHFPPSVLSKILYATVNDNYHNKKNLKIWKQINQDLLDQAFITFFNIVTMEKGTYIEKKSAGLPYEAASDIIERPALDVTKLGPAPEKATITLSDDEFLNELERDTNE